MKPAPPPPALQSAANDSRRAGFQAVSPDALHEPTAMIKAPLLFASFKGTWSDDYLARHSSNPVVRDLHRQQEFPAALLRSAQVAAELGR